MKRCIVFQGVSQPQYFRIATKAAKSAKKQMPDVDTVLLTDLPGESPYWDKIIRLEPVDLIDAHLLRLWELPEYDSGISLDADVYICMPLYDVFELVEDRRIDIALVHTSGKEESAAWLYPADSVPTAFPHVRGAFVAFQDHAQTRGFFSLWRDLFCEHREKYGARMAHKGPCYPNRQVLRIALYRSNLSMAILPPKYCCTCGGVSVRGSVRIVTGGRGIDTKALARAANRNAPRLRFLQHEKVTILD